MTRVTMRGQLSGTRDGVDWPARGEFADLPDDEAQQLITNGLALEGEVDLATGGPLTKGSLDGDVETAEGRNASSKSRRH
jgi:hypothetical protein